MNTCASNKLRRSIAILIATMGVTAGAQAQRNFNISLAQNGTNGFVISWIAQSATPQGDFQIIPQFQVLRSLDLTNWTAIGNLMTGALDQILTFTDTNNPRAFYRVQSIINEESSNLDNAKLALGQLSGANFFGAQLYNADLAQAVLTGANLQAADIGNATLTNANLSGANLFFVEASGAQFDNGEMAQVNAALGDFSGASFVNTDLTGVDFSSATLVNANLFMATTNGANFDDAIFGNTTMPDGSIRNQ